jgi:cobalt/nickel transport system ATP-binding protein
VTAIVEARGLWFAYEGGEPVLRNVTFAVEPGERVGILGPNGSGKSTLLWCLVGLYKPSGEVRLFGEPVHRKLLERVGIVFQNPEDMLFMPSLAADLCLPLLNRGVAPAEADRRAREALARLGLDGLASKDASSLSLGQRKRAAIAAALATSPELLLLDEPTAELDGRSARTLAAALLELGVTTLVTSHDLTFLGRIATRLLVLVEGEIAAAGPPEEILTDTTRLEAWGLL